MYQIKTARSLVILQDENQLRKTCLSIFNKAQNIGIIFARNGNPDSQVWKVSLGQSWCLHVDLTTQTELV